MKTMHPDKTVMTFDVNGEKRTLVGPPVFLAPGEETEPRVTSPESRDSEPAEQPVESESEESSPQRE